MQLAKVLARKFPLTEHTITPRDCMLYALGVGVGDRPNAAEDLQFVYEDQPGGLKVFPAMVNVICHPGPWVKEPELEIEWVKLLHGEQSFTYHHSACAGDTVTVQSCIDDIYDKKNGALEFLVKSSRATNQNNQLVAEMRTVLVVRN